MRIIAIDRLRGLAIILMVFFTLILLFCRNVPAILQHNVENALRFGDFVLPLFLFSSGMSLFFFAQKSKKKIPSNLQNPPNPPFVKGGLEHCSPSSLGGCGLLVPPFSKGGLGGIFLENFYTSNLLLKFLKRITLFWIIWIILSPFSAGQLFGMDELALSLFLSCITILVVRCKTVTIALVTLLPMVIYLVLYWTHHLPSFKGYLGGYAALPFYLPVMLGGVIAAKHRHQIPKLILPCAFLTVGLLFLVPPHKLIASPSFMMLSVLFSLIGFYGIQYCPCSPIETIGRNPLRYWILMWIFIISALLTYPNYLGALFAQNFTWPIATLLCFACMGILYLISKGMDWVK